MFLTLVRTLNGWVVSLCQLLALFVIVTGIIKALIIYCKYIFSNSRSAIAFQASRLELGYSFSLGLSFLVGGSILKTTIAPTWNDIGQLAVIIAIRTILNYLMLQAINKSSNDSPQQSLLPEKQSTVSSKLMH
ncbi:conserved membrane hypothetical protein [Hyella patelloides LEGE 07179]|uniref:DUF1622 domain-containing protein n=1 Tax=Hyella patelloides LEGE 07179 TaxID=945734 RepID=A0A563VJB8_9CYAN|nr:DUF1622 domain-containing protein [Hyella patelloides]VEP11415.1 conserved membrane hypothetical protein [Hyella patelloides LEGE 07179]